MTYVYSVNAADIEDDTDEFRFIGGLPDDPAEEERILAFLAAAQVYVMGQVLYESFAEHFQGKTAAAHPFAPIYAHGQGRLLAHSRVGGLGAHDDQLGRRRHRGREAEERGRRLHDRDWAQRHYPGPVASHLIDEFHIHGLPVAVGSGQSDVELGDVGESKPLELVSCHPCTNGVVVLHYCRRR